MTREEFNSMYWAAQPPAVRALREMPVDETRTAKAVELAQQGFQINIPIMVFGWDPHNQMECDAMNGFKWRPALLQTGFTVAQNPIGPGEVSQDTPMPKGAIKVSLEAADYPPFDPPIPGPLPSPVKNPVGFLLYGNVFAGSPGDSLLDWPEGSSYADSRGKFTKHAKQTMFGAQCWWEKVA